VTARERDRPIDIDLVVASRGPSRHFRPPRIIAVRRTHGLQKVRCSSLILPQAHSARP
jgi:hypothetical protein